MSLAQVTNTTTDVAQLVVQIIVYWTDGSDPKVGSGILLDGKTVLTAAHVVDNFHYDNPPVQKTIDRIEVIPARDGNQTPYGTHTGDIGSIALWPGYTGGQSPPDFNDDVAIFKVSGSGVSIAPEKYLGLSAFYGRDAVDAKTW